MVESIFIWKKKKKPAACFVFCVFFFLREALFKTRIVIFMLQF